MEKYIGVKVPCKIAFFAWTTTLCKILIVDYIWKSYSLIIDWCCMWKCSKKVCSSSSLHCSAVRDSWSFVFILVGAFWVMLKTVI